jgi:hypothetical protein
MTGVEKHIDNDVVRKSSSMNTQIKVSAKNGVASIMALNENTQILFLGASCSCSAQPDQGGIDVLTVAPNKGEQAVVALITICKYHKAETLIVGGLVYLYWKDDRLMVDYDVGFVSPADRLGQVIATYIGGGRLQVIVNGQVFFCTGGYDSHAKMEQGKKEGHRFVSDCNLLCRYLVGQATFEELEAAASGDLRSAEQIQLDQAQEQIRNLTEECGVFQKTIAGQVQNIAILESGLRIANSQIDQLSERGQLKTQIANSFGTRVRNFFRPLEFW